MTKETIIKSTLKYLVKRQIEEGSVGFAVDNDHDHDCCWDDVLAWIEAQPCEDCISRQKALDCFEQTNTRQGAKYAIETLPSVTPKGVTVTDFADKCKECGKIQNEFFNFDAPMVKKSDAVSREAVKELVVKEFVNPQDGMEEWRNAVNDVVEEILHNIETMPSVTPERPKGKWIEIEIDAGEFIYKCTKCGMRVINPYKYCPICGSNNGGGEDG